MVIDCSLVCKHSLSSSSHDGLGCGPAFFDTLVVEICNFHFSILLCLNSVNWLQDGTVSALFLNALEMYISSSCSSFSEKLVGVSMKMFQVFD